MPSAPERQTCSCKQPKRKHFHPNEGQRAGWHQHSQVSPDRGRFPLTPVLQTEARALKGHPGAQQMEADASPVLRPLSIEGQYL